MAIPMPGPYQVSGTIQEILQRRREEARQALLDKLQIDRGTAEMENDKQRLDLQRTQQEDNALTNQLQRSASQQALDIGKLDALGEVPMPTSGMDPATAELARRFGRTRNMPPTPPEFPAIEPPAMLADTTETYVPPAFAKEEDARNRISRAMGQIQPGMSELQRAMILREAEAIQNVPEESFAAPRQAIPISPDQRTPVSLGPRDVPIPRSYEPGSYQGAFFPPYVDGSGNAVFFSTKPGADGKPTRVDMPGAGGMGRLGAPEQNEFATALQTMRGNIMQNQRLIGARRDDALHEANLSVVNFHRSASPAVKQAVQAALTTMRKYQESRVPLPAVKDFLDIAAKQYGLGPQDLPVVEDMITILSPYYASEEGSAWDWLF